MAGTSWSAGGAVEVREGSAAIGRLVVLEFPSVEAARTFYDSPDYQAIVPIRQANAELVALHRRGRRLTENVTLACVTR